MGRPSEVTLADLIVLSLLAERPRHGYDLWTELERRQVQDWASITKAQVYYSLRKLEAAGHIVAVAGEESLGPERRVYNPTDDGRRVVATELAHAKWATQRPPDPFVTWMALAWQLRPRDFDAQIARRRKFLEEQVAKERETLDAVIAETNELSDAAMMVRLGIRTFEVELAWLDEVAARPRKARHSG